MPISIDLAPLLALPEEERLAIADALYESVPDDETAEPPPEVTPEFAAELRRRVADAMANPDAGLSWEQVRDRARARHGR